MKVLVVGGGGREHVIVKKLKENPVISELFCAPGNGGIARDARCVDIKATDIDGMVRFAVENKMDYVVVAPDDPLVLGMADALTRVGIRCFGPDKAAARIEGSKVFSKGLMRKYGIPTAAYAVFDDPLKAESYIRRKDSFPVVIKADGLALGKGVVIAQSMDEALVALKSIMQDQVFGASGNQIVIEDYLTGPEVTVLAFADGDTIIPMVSSMDHKRALEGNRGLNTGGMGTIAPNPHYSADIASVCMEKIFLPTIRAMKDEGCPFKGCLYFGLMLTPRGPMVIEYNCRFGDPEAQVVLPLLETDLFEIMQAVTDTKLAALDIKWKDAHAACVILASGGYPEEYTTGYPINGLDDKGDMPGAAVYHAGTQYKDGQFLTAGGRVLGVTCTAANLSDALDAAYGAVSRISFKDAFFRRDIGRY